MFKIIIIGIFIGVIVAIIAYSFVTNIYEVGKKEGKKEVNKK